MFRTVFPGCETNISDGGGSSIDGSGRCDWNIFVDPWAQTEDHTTGLIKEELATERKRDMNLEDKRQALSKFKELNRVFREYVASTEAPTSLPAPTAVPAKRQSGRLVAAIANVSENTELMTLYNIWQSSDHLYKTGCVRTSWRCAQTRCFLTEFSKSVQDLQTFSTAIVKVLPQMNIRLFSLKESL